MNCQALVEEIKPLFTHRISSLSRSKRLVHHHFRRLIYTFLSRFCIKRKCDNMYLMCTQVFMRRGYPVRDVVDNINKWISTVRRTGSMALRRPSLDWSTMWFWQCRQQSFTFEQSSRWCDVQFIDSPAATWRLVKHTCRRESKRGGSNSKFPASIHRWPEGDAEMEGND